MSVFQVILNEVDVTLQQQLLVFDGVKVTTLSVVIMTAGTFLLLRYIPSLNVKLIRMVPFIKAASLDFQKTILRLSRIILMIVGVFVLFHFIGIDTSLLKEVHGAYSSIQNVLDLKLFKLGNSQLTLLTVVYVLFVSLLLVRGSSQLHNILLSKYLAKTKMDLGAKQAVASAAHYSVLFVGFVILLQTAGIDLSAMTVLMGALGIGISFGLQTITQNLVSGIIILFERPIKIGDRVQIGDVTGEVINISLRATTVITHENKAIFVPNSQFITSNVVNWSFNGRTIGLKLPISVPSVADPELVQKVISDILDKNPEVLKSPAPRVVFEELSKDSMKFSIRVWTDNFIELPDSLLNDLNFAVARKLRKVE